MGLLNLTIYSRPTDYIPYGTDDSLPNSADLVTEEIDPPTAGVSAPETDYGYDAFGRMVSRTPVTGLSDETAQSFIYDGQNIVMVLDGEGAVQQRYLYGPGGQSLGYDVAAGTGSGFYFYWDLSDGQGTVRGVSKSLPASGGAVETDLRDGLVYDSFGQVTSQSDSSYQPALTYDGSWQDPATGLIEMGLRWYDPADAVFVSQDPSGLGGGDTNTERFVGNSPTNFVDPSGLAEMPLDASLDDSSAVNMRIWQAEQYALKYGTLVPQYNQDGTLNQQFVEMVCYLADSGGTIPVRRAMAQMPARQDKEMSWLQTLIYSVVPIPTPIRAGSLRGYVATQQQRGVVLWKPNLPSRIKDCSVRHWGGDGFIGRRSASA